MNAAATGPVIKHKNFTYRTSLDDVFERFAMMHSSGKPDLQVNAPPEFKGEPGFWTPEDLFVASIESCLMLTIVGIAEKRGVEMVSYTSSAEGSLEWREGGYEFTKIIVRPNIVVSYDEAAASMHEIVARAHDACLIAKSVRSTLVLEPTIAVVNVSVG